MNTIFILLKFVAFFLFSLLLFACSSDSQNDNAEVVADSTAIANQTKNLAFQEFMQKFDTVSPPYTVGILPKLNRLTDSTHSFLRNCLDGKPLVNIPQEFEGMWKRTHHDKFSIGEHKPIAGVSVIEQNDKFVLLEIADLEEISYNDSLYAFRKTTFLCTFSPQGEYINGLAACYANGDPMGGVERKTTVSQDLKILINEFGYEKMKLPKGYKIDASYQIQPDGKFVHLDSKVVK